MEIFKEKWAQFAAAATTIFAVCAAISTLRGGGCSTKIQLLTTKEANAWAYFQSKSIKQHATELQKDTFTVAGLECKPATLKLVQTKIRLCEADIKRYDEEKKTIKEEAENYGKYADVFKSRSVNFGMAAMLLQIAIMLNSIAVLMKRSWMFALGVAVGLSGIAYMVMGLWF